MDRPGNEGDAVRLEGVRKTYGAGDSEVVALAGVTVGFAQGTFTAVMGPSGSGKSTLLHCAAGLDQPDAGSVTIEGVELTGMSENELTKLRRDRIGFVFQAFNLLPALNATQNVAVPMRLAGRKPDAARIESVLGKVGLANRRDHMPGQMSGGQQQRVAIARALATGPAVIFADEPTGALDTSTAREVLGLLRDAVDKDGQTIVMVTHDPMAASYADKAIFLADGRLAGELRSPTPDSVAERMTRIGAWQERVAAR
ncbi:ABC transporter ATP-binding protein [Amycolatopsis samaneae]|uniref:ABC transporter ATP-binding protein n=1 Tax=Amycolatopsis samaneae TaxID=664691 RepID=A0ABW5GD08_9PSEU